MTDVTLDMSETYLLHFIMGLLFVNAFMHLETLFPFSTSRERCLFASKLVLTPKDRQQQPKFKEMIRRVSQGHRGGVSLRWDVDHIQVLDVHLGYMGVMLLGKKQLADEEVLTISHTASYFPNFLWTYPEPETNVSQLPPERILYLMSEMTQEECMALAEQHKDHNRNLQFKRAV